MREASSFLRRAGSRMLTVVLLAAATALGGCAGGNGAANSYAMAPSAGSGATVAFESIDGPPPQVFDRMVGMLDSESKLRSLSVVSREGTAAYRVRSYLSAQVVRGKTMIAWVWDVYDANQQRALRLSGEEPTAGKGGRDPWSAADDLVLRRIAQAGFSGLSNMINGTSDARGTVPGLRGPAVASVAPEAPAAVALGYAER
ncbi:hypothetical protein AB8Z38_28735 [Bradyrhizobium sp. LLZ17]|uniref:Uncharacterized protein n=1 Tax=Bradyrhizobium sp. LLZ17 TaxID=3239388 RepID=A0AB39XGP8_9BRAD